MAIKEPEVRHNIEFGKYLPLSVRTSVLTDMNNAIEHQHRRQWQLCVAWPEQFTMPALKQGLSVKTRLSLHTLHQTPLRHFSISALI
jgi:hypothetical protein